MNRQWILTIAIVVLPVPDLGAQDTVASLYFGIQVIDEQTGRGVPLVELRTVNGISHHTDSAGWIAFHEPGLMDRQVYFAVSSPGYEHAQDGFGFRGVRLHTKSGAIATVKVKRINLAERVCRLTGQGIYRDATLLGLKIPSPAPNLNANVLSQDSVQAVKYRGKIFWLWGDTNVSGYPLGNFQTTAAWSPAPGQPGARPGAGIAFEYLTDARRGDGLRRMAPLKEPGVVWLFGLLTINDDRGVETLVAHYTRRKSLAEQVEHGLVRFDDEQGIFKKLTTLDLKEAWRYPRGNAVSLRQADGEYYYFASPFCATRVPARWAALIDPAQYEALALNDQGEYVWQRERPPITQADELKQIRAGKLKPERARYALTDAASGKPVAIHGASVNWNHFRKKWVMIGVEAGTKGSSSLLGEVWYAEADAIDGPWRKALKIASHPKYSYYNPRHHAFFDDAGGRVIYFEGTYTHTFSGNPTPTPRYDYNQLLYRLDLADERLKAQP